MQDFLGFLLITGLLAIGISLLISGQLARPIFQLIEYTRKAFQEENSVMPIITAGGEVGELAEAFQTMIENLEKSKEHVIHVRASELAVIGEMAASMAHEVRTPLGISRSSAQMLRRERQLSSEGEEMVSFIVSETDRLNRLVTTLLKCARPTPPQVLLNDIHFILDHVIELLKTSADKKSIIIHTRYDAEKKECICDKDQITQVFLNLLVNALYWTPAKTTIEMTTANANNQLEVQICDNGPGISCDDPQQVVDPFFSQRDEGIGLGLTVVQQIILAHCGEINVFNSAHGGACFRLMLPLNPNNASKGLA